MDVEHYARSSGPAIFLEITDREDLGQNLIAPQADEGGGNRYWLITESRPGDTVLHYHRPSGGIIGVSRVAGLPEDATLLWAAKGSSARGKSIDPYERPAWRVDLAAYTPLDPPTAQAEVNTRRPQILEIKSRLEKANGTGLQFPYYQYRDNELRTLQAYLAIYPRELLDVFPALKAQLLDHEATVLAEVRQPETDPADPALYVANEDIQVSRSGEIKIDPHALTRANQSHARLQNLLRTRVQEHHGTLTGPALGVNVDLAWMDRRGRQFIAEVKSLTALNEVHQIRYGLGQLLDYLDEYALTEHPATGVLFIARPPTNRNWIRKCAAVDVQLCWPGMWPKS